MSDEGGAMRDQGPWLAAQSARLTEKQVAVRPLSNGGGKKCECKLKNKKCKLQIGGLTARQSPR
jgi:hypothetical protein